MAEQISLFDGFLDDPSVKPPIGTKVIFFYEGKRYPAIVTSHCGETYDFFYIKFTGRQPSDDDSEVKDSGGWHVSMRGKGKDWCYDR